MYSVEYRSFTKRWFNILYGTFTNDMLSDETNTPRSNVQVNNPNVLYRKKRAICQGMRYIHPMSYALFTITKLPNNELTGIHTRDLSPLLL